MGCCISTARRDHDGHNAPNSHRSPPLEDETVKEVLSETPFHAPTPDPPTPKVSETLSHDLQQQEKTALKEGEAVSVHDEGDASEYSEICSVSGSFSTATTNTTIAAERGEVVENDDAISRELEDVVKVRQTVVSRRSMVQSPTTTVKKFTVTKPKHPPVIRSVSGQGHVQRQFAAGDRRRSELCGALPVSSQRSRSPATVRSPARGRIGNSSVREVGSMGKASGDSRKYFMANAREGRKMKEALNSLNSPSPADESLLDNPLVSLECFIFL